MSQDRIEFYDTKDGQMFASVNSSMSLIAGNLVSIRKEVWRVEKVAFALDNADADGSRGMRCNVDATKVR